MRDVLIQHPTQNLDQHRDWVIYPVTLRGRQLGVTQIRINRVKLSLEEKMDKVDQREYPLYTVDAFTSVRFSGNPAAVCLLTANRSLCDRDRQKIAAEINLSETAFIEGETDEDFKTGCRFKLRWFTPTNEVALCGHATLASAAVLFSVIGNKSQMIEFDTLSGVLTTRRENKEIILNFPVNHCTQQTKEDYRELLKNILDEELVQSIEYSLTTKKLLVRLQDNITREFLEGLKPDTDNMMKCKLSPEVKGVIVTVRGSSSQGTGDKSCGDTLHYDFISRYFAPWNGIPEDPVTGSAHTVLASYWSKVLNKSEMFARQCSPRGGDVRIRIQGERVDLIGQGVVMLSGKLTL